MFTETEALKTVDLLLDAYRTPAILLHRPYPPTTFPPVRSRLGGRPQLPEEFDWPWGREGGKDVPLHFLAQIDCAELPRIDARLPAEGMLFFFARDDAEQVWSDGTPRDSVRVIYAPTVATGQPERAPPPELPPIGNRLRGQPKWLLPEERGLSLHASWPLVPMRIDSWPDYSAIVDTPIFRDTVTHGIGFGELDRISAARMWSESQVPAPDGYEDARTALQVVGPLYERRVKASRLATVIAATELPTHTALTPAWGRTPEGRFFLPTDTNFKDRKIFPQAGIVIDRIARLLVHYVLSLQTHLSYRHAKTQAQLLKIEAAARRWIDRAAAIGFDVAPSQEEATEFATWLTELATHKQSFGMVDRARRFLARSRAKRRGQILSASTGEKALPIDLQPMLAWELSRIFPQALSSSILYAAGAPRAAALLPAYFYNALENDYLPFEQSKRAINVTCEGWHLRARIHQMLGHAPSAQEAEPVDSPRVLLLQLCWDRAIGMEFGDVGAASFWIAPEHLAERRFDQAWGEVDGH